MNLIVFSDDRAFQTLLSQDGLEGVDGSVHLAFLDGDLVKSRGNSEVGNVPLGGGILRNLAGASIFVVDTRTMSDSKSHTQLSRILALIEQARATGPVTVVERCHSTSLLNGPFGACTSNDIVKWHEIGLDKDLLICSEGTQLLHRFVSILSGLGLEFYDSKDLSKMYHTLLTQLMREKVGRSRRRRTITSQSEVSLSSDSDDGFGAPRRTVSPDRKANSLRDKVIFLAEILGERDVAHYWRAHVPGQEMPSRKKVKGELLQLFAKPNTMPFSVFGFARRDPGPEQPTPRSLAELLQEDMIVQIFDNFNDAAEPIFDLTSTGQSHAVKLCHSPEQACAGMELICIISSWQALKGHVLDWSKVLKDESIDTRVPAYFIEADLKHCLGMDSSILSNCKFVY